MAFVIGQALWAFPGGDWVTATIVGTVLAILFIALVFALMSMAMPRSGGDYIYVSRIIHPTMGFGLNFAIAMFLAFFVAFGAYWGAGLAVSTLLGTMGYYANVPTLVIWSVALQNVNNLFILSSILIVIFALIVVSGLRNYLRFNNGLFVIGLIGFVIAVAAMVVTSPTAFQQNFNHFMTTFTNDTDYYHTVIAQAKSAGFNPSAGFSAINTLLMIPMFLSIAAFIQGSVYIGGEVKHASRTQLYSMPIALVVLSVGTIILFTTARNMAGAEFWNSINWLWWQGQPLALPLWPFFNLWATLASNNIALAAIAGIGFIALGIQYPPMNLMVCTRMIFSWSFDRIFPSKFANVSSRTHSPVWGVIFMAAVSEMFLVIFTYTSWLTGIAGIAGSITVYLFVSIAAVIFPYRKKEMYQASPISKYKVGSIPLITILGIGGVALDLFLLISYVTVGGYLANSSTSLSLIIGIILLGFVLFSIAWGYRKSKGMNILSSFKELPPE